MPVPAWVAVVTAFEAFAHLEHREHAAHFQVAERAVAAHHRQRVGRQRHLHVAHRAALVAHDHIAGHQLVDLLGHAPMVDANERWHVMAHCVHRVVRFVAVEGPVARRIGHELDCAHLADGDVGRHLGPARRLRHPAAIRASDLEAVPVQVDRVVRHRQVAHADAHLVAQARDHRIQAREHAAVDGPQIKVEHRVGARRVAARFDVVRR
jgi:hypothetical protein